MTSISTEDATLLMKAAWAFGILCGLGLCWAGTVINEFYRDWIKDRKLKLICDFAEKHGHLPDGWTFDRMRELAK